ncbi:hypothetical protein JCM10212_001622 [Sporobolomyces blumeae]
MSLPALLGRRLRPAVAASTPSAVHLFSTSCPAPANRQLTWDEDGPSSYNRVKERTSKSARSSPSWVWKDRDEGDAVERKPKTPRKQVHAHNHKPYNVTPEELEKRERMRIARAERLERKDLTAQMTETKTYMGGFTQPRHLHFLNTLDPTRKAKDAYDVRVGENRVRPSAEAYEPHTVYLAVTRYPVRWGHGRATRRECFSGFCKESELPDRFKALNYGTWKEEETRLVKLHHGRPKEPVVTPAHWHCLDESKEYLDLAVFPGSPEERSMLNKPVSHRLRAVSKEVAREEEAVKKAKAAGQAVDHSALDQAKETFKATRRELLPPVAQDWARPEPPYLEPPLVVPLLTVTLPTRPLASTLARLCNSHPRGLPFISSIPDADRKDGPSTFRRLLRMRANRIHELTKELVHKLQGYGGGLMSVRMSPEDRGRGIEGEGLGDEIKMPERGWAEFSLLDEASSIWNGIERDMYLSSWEVGDGIKAGPAHSDHGSKPDCGSGIEGTTQMEQKAVEEGSA